MKGDSERYRQMSAVLAATESKLFLKIGFACRIGCYLLASRTRQAEHLGLGHGFGIGEGGPRLMAGPAAFFLGDLDDPWVRAIADALPPGTRHRSYPGELPELWPAEIEDARTLVLHRSILTKTDADRIRQLKEHATAPLKVVLCMGPHARYHQWAQWAALAEAIVPEATAAETVARHMVGGLSLKPADPRPTVAVVSTLFELRSVLAETCSSLGYDTDSSREWTAVAQAEIVVWDVPVLEDSWPETLAIQARGKRMICLLGFADRQSVTLAKAHGASACLEVPLDPADLGFVLDRLAISMRGPSLPSPHADPAHTVPPSPVSLRRLTLKRSTSEP
jgi:hypothetical protein